MADPYEGIGGEREHHRAVSNRAISQAYGRWLTFLLLSGVDLQREQPTDRIARERVVAFIKELAGLGNAPGTVLERLEGISVFAKLADPARDWSFLSKLASRVRRLPARPRKIVLVETDELFALGVRLMAEAPARRGEVRQAVQFRDGLMIALLALRPLRLKNLAALRIGETLVDTGQSIVIRFTAEEMKNHSPLDLAWPDDLRAQLRAYLESYRERLKKQRGRWYADPGAALWISGDGSAMTHAGIFWTIVKRTLAAFGVAINPHRFRHAAMSTLAMRDPKHVRIGSSLLSHRSQKTGDRYYNMADSLEAHRRFARVISSIRGLR